MLDRLLTEILVEEMNKPEIQDSNEVEERHAKTEEETHE